MTNDVVNSSGINILELFSVLLAVLAIAAVIVTAVKFGKTNPKVPLFTGLGAVIVLGILAFCMFFNGESGGLGSSMSREEMLQVAKYTSIDEFTFEKTQSSEARKYIGNVYEITGYVSGIGTDNTFVIVGKYWTMSSSGEPMYRPNDIHLNLNQEDMKKVQKDKPITFIGKVTEVKNIFTMDGYLK